ncbi:MAG: CdaR family protein [Pyrinomonadaceae bacterium]
MRGSLFAKHVGRKIFLEDWAMKLTALVITFGLWFGVTGLSTPTTKRVTVPLNLSISNNTEVTNVPQLDVEIVISGDKRKIDQINKSELAATLDLTDVAPGDRVVSLSPENVYVALPQGIKLVEIQPSRIPVNLEAVEEKEIDVKVNAEGSPAAGFEVYNSTALPPKIRVRGPASFIRTLNFVETGVIDLAGRSSEFTAKQIPVSVANPKASVLNTVVDVYFRIGDKRVERSFSVPIFPGKVANFTLYGPRTLLSKTRSDAFKIDLTDETAPQLALPADLQDLVEVRRLIVK